MKKLIFITLLFSFCFTLTKGQIVDPNKVVKKQGTRRANNKIEQGVDEGFDKLEGGIGSLFGKKKARKKKATNEESENTSEKKEVSNRDGEDNSNQQVAKKTNVVWNKFDFVPGDVVIFEDGPDLMEENGEFPSRWDLVKGQVEIASVNGENVIMCIDGNPEIIPYLKNSKEDYLPDVFTIEFDFYKPVNGNRITVYLYDTKNQERVNGMNMDISSGTISEDLSGVSGNILGIDYRNSKDARWSHVSIAFTRGKLKVYVDDTRVINIPHYSGNPSGLTLQAYFAELNADKPFYFKNIRIAKGGVKYYDRVLQDGKIICNGIRFDVNKASLKPESMGPINKIYQLLQKQPDLNFSVEGHTDSDGDDTSNKRLSEARAKVVMEKLIQMGISSNRLSYAGYGESKPLDNNSTPEGKANNRRVEFVKVDGNPTTSNSSSNSIFNSLDRNAIDAKMRSLPKANIQVANQSGVVLKNGTTIIYGSSDGNIGKMEVLNVDKNDNFKLTVRYVTYNNDGSVLSKSNHLEIGGTYTCDLDEGKTENLISSEEDFWLSRKGAKEARIEASENTGFYLVTD